MSKVKSLLIGGAMTLVSLAVLAFISRSFFPASVQKFFSFSA